MLNKLEEYQAITSEEGEHIDMILLYLKMFSIKSKILNEKDKKLLLDNVIYLVSVELEFIDKIENEDASLVLKEILYLIMKA